MSNDTSLIIQNQTPEQFKKNHNELITFVKSQLKEAKNIANGEGGDWGIIPYTKNKSLLKPGAEKLLKLFGFTAKFELVKEIEDWDKKFIYYRYKCVITHAASGTFIADAVRSCNNKERKHANKDVYDVANTIEAIAQKRALVAATVQATMASEIFDADVSENDEEAPNKGVTEAEDPRRVRIFGGLYGKASARGLSGDWLHEAAKRRFGIKESLTELSNEKLEEFSELIIEYYEEVPKGEKPKRREVAVAPTPVTEVTEEEVAAGTLTIESIAEKRDLVAATEVEEVDLDEVEKGLEAKEKEAEVVKCYQDQKPIPEIRNTDSPYFCSKECQDLYYPEKSVKQGIFNMTKSA